MGKGAALRLPARRQSGAAAPPKDIEAYPTACTFDAELALQFFPDLSAGVNDDFFAGVRDHTLEDWSLGSLCKSQTRDVSREASPDLITRGASFNDAFAASGVVLPVPAFGELAVDSLFSRNPYASPAAFPSRTPSPFTRDVRAACGSASPALTPDVVVRDPLAAMPEIPQPVAPVRETSSAVAPAAAPAAHPAHPSTIYSAFASDGSTGARVVVSRAPKRKGPDPESDSEGSIASVVALEEADAPAPVSVAHSLDTYQEVEEALQRDGVGGIPKCVVTAGREEVTISPTVLRLENAAGLLVCLGLKSEPARGSQAPVTAYDQMNPKIITTGRPARPAGVASARAARCAPAQPPTTRSFRGAKVVKTEREPSVEPGAAAASSREQSGVQKLWLLQRRLDTGRIVASHVMEGDFEEATAFTANISWGCDSAFGVDVVAKIRSPCGDTFWLKAEGRNVLDSR